LPLDSETKAGQGCRKRRNRVPNWSEIGCRFPPKSGVAFSRNRVPLCSDFCTPFLASEGCFWLGVPADGMDDTPHPAPRRMLLVTTQGEYQVTTSRGVIKKFPVGSVLLVEDVSGAGHSTKVTGTEDLIIFAANLPAA
jgi:hypothetical protein